MAPYFSPNSVGDGLAVVGDFRAGGGDGPVQPLQLVVHRVARNEPAGDAKSLVVHHQRFADGDARRNGDPLKFLHRFTYRSSPKLVSEELRQGLDRRFRFLADGLQEHLPPQLGAEGHDFQHLARVGALPLLGDQRDLGTEWRTTLTTKNIAAQVQSLAIRHGDGPAGFRNSLIAPPAHSSGFLMPHRLTSRTGCYRPHRATAGCPPGLADCLRNLQNVSSRSCREMFSRAPGGRRAGRSGEIRRKKSCTFSPSRLLKSTPSLLTATVPTSRSTLGCLVCGTATPRPIPVLPNSSRFMIALTMLLAPSAALILPTSERAWIISRMTPSLSSAANSA